MAMAKAQTALERAERVLAQLLVLARVDVAAGAGPLQAVNVVALAKDLTAEAVPMALEREVDLGFEGPDEALALAEPVLLAELVKNLLANAMAYAGLGAVVTVRVRQSPEGVVLEVEDNGPGLTEAQIAQARARRRGLSREGRADQPPGYGFGLAITSEIAALFGTEVELAKPATGRGLLARVTLQEAQG